MTPLPPTLSPGEVVESSATVEGSDEYYQNLNVHLICPECQDNPPNLVDEYASGDTVCGTCGLVLQSHVVDTRSEWRTFSNGDENNDDPSRVGAVANTLLNGSQLESFIAFGQGNSIAKDLHRAQNKVANNKSNNILNAAYKQIDAYCNAIHLSSRTSDSAKALFKAVEDEKAFKGKPQEAIIAGCIFIACRQTFVPRTFKEITGLTQVAKKEIGRTFKALEKFYKKTMAKNPNILAGGVVMATNGYQATSATKAEDVCGRYCSNLGLSMTISTICEAYADLMVHNGILAGRSPVSVAAATIYAISHLMGSPKSAKEIANVCGVSDGTVRSAYRLMCESGHDRFIKPEWLAKGGKIENLPPV